MEEQRRSWTRNPAVWIAATVLFLLLGLKLPSDGPHGLGRDLPYALGVYFADVAIALVLWALVYFAFLRRRGGAFLSPAILVVALALALISKAGDVGRDLEAKQKAHDVMGAQYTKANDAVRGCVAGGMDDYERTVEHTTDFPYTKKQWALIITRLCQKADREHLINGKPLPKPTMKRLLTASIHELHEEGKLPPSAPDPAGQAAA